jgi:hypothetical protein
MCLYSKSRMADARIRKVIKTICKPLDHVNMFIVNSPALKVGLIQLDVGALCTPTPT